MDSAIRKQHVKLINILCDNGLVERLQQLSVMHLISNEPLYQDTAVPWAMRQLIVDPATRNAIVYVAGLRQCNIINKCKTKEAQQDEIRDKVLGQPALAGHIAKFMGYAKELFPGIKDKDHKYGGFYDRAAQEAENRVPQYESVEQFQQQIMLKPNKL